MISITVWDLTHSLGPGLMGQSALAPRYLVLLVGAFCLHAFDQGVFNLLPGAPPVCWQRCGQLPDRGRNLWFRTWFSSCLSWVALVLVIVFYLELSKIDLRQDLGQDLWLDLGFDSLLWYVLCAPIVGTLSYLSWLRICHVTCIDYYLLLRYPILTCNLNWDRTWN